MRCTVRETRDATEIADKSKFFQVADGSLGCVLSAMKVTARTRPDDLQFCFAYL